MRQILPVPKPILAKSTLPMMPQLLNLRDKVANQQATNW
jgi:hypothetical protein